jgi:hypothetical protein
MAAKTSRGSVIVASGVFGGLVVVVGAQHMTTWALASQTNALMAAVGGAVVGGAIGWIATRKKPVTA